MEITCQVVLKRVTQGESMCCISNFGIGYDWMLKFKRQYKSASWYTIRMALGILNEYTAVAIKGKVAVSRYLAMSNPSIVIGGRAVTNLSGRERHELVA